LFKFNSNWLKNHASTIFFFVLLTVFISSVTYKCFQIQMSIGPIWDTYDLLSDAALFAGKSIGYYDLVRPPFLPFLTSLFFRVDGLVTWPIMLIDGLIFILGSVGFYFFLKLRFDNLTSFLGALLFSTFPIVLSFVCTGLSDIPSVCISIWALLFTVLAIKRDSKFFYLSFPLAMIAFLTRFTSALIVFPMVLYILMNLGEIKPKRDILIGILFSFLIFLPIFYLFYVNFGNPLYTFLDFFHSSSGSASTMANMLFYYNSDFFYFLKSMPSFIGPEAMGVVLVILLGFIIYPFKRWKKRNSMEKNQNKSKTSFPVLLRKNKIKFLLSLTLIIFFVLTIQRVNYLVSEVIFFAFSYLIYDLLKGFEFKNIDLDFLFLSWFMAFFIFHSVYMIKDYRYFIIMAPAVSYFLMRGFRLTTSLLGIEIKNRNVTHYLFSVFLIFLIIFSTYSYLPSIGETNNYLKQLNDNTITISAWLVNYDPEYKNKIIYSDIWPYSGWYLKMNIRKMPQFINNQAIYTAVTNYNYTAQDIMAYNHELDVNHADYYFSRRKGLNFTNYKPIKQVGTLTLYQRVE
jgi:4-amino-4-deoxy-L-arabinose transferase-like glycosyltransferase